MNEPKEREKGKRLTRCLLDARNSLGGSRKFQQPIRVILAYILYFLAAFLFFLLYTFGKKVSVKDKVTKEEKLTRPNRPPSPRGEGRFSPAHA
jgi:hypothetical protein